MHNLDHENEEHTQQYGWDDATAAKYADEFGDHPINQMTAEKANLTKEDRVLDIGCGTGSALRAAAKLAGPSEMYGIDPTAVMIKRARDLSSAESGMDSISFIQSSAEKIPLSEDQATIVWAINSMHHWSDIHKGFCEIKRVLVHDGRLLIVEEIFEENIGMEMDQIKAQLEDAGFDVSTTEVWETPDCNMNVVSVFNKK